jgi:coenzyme F420-0:L-glutamate ligase / coenzyme F420-1:gamma-L-glutamate ligase
MSLVLTGIPGIPLIQPGDDLAEKISNSVKLAGIKPQDGDIWVCAQKIISKAENRLINLKTVVPTQKAIDIAQETGKDPRFVELVLLESEEVLRVKPGALIVEHKSGFICANAGIDHSNVNSPSGEPEDWVLLLPENASKSATTLRTALEINFRKSFGVLIIDSHGRAWRNGTVGTSIGFSGMPGVVDLRGRPDLFGFKLQITQVGAADELAAAASLVMGQGNESIPVVLARGFPYPLRDGSLKEVIRTKDEDLFR